MQGTQEMKMELKTYSKGEWREKRPLIVYLKMARTNLALLTSLTREMTLAKEDPLPLLQ